MHSLASICDLTVRKTGSFLSYIATWTNMIHFHKNNPKSSARLRGDVVYIVRISSIAIPSLPH